MIFTNADYHFEYAEEQKQAEPLPSAQNYINTLINLDANLDVKSITSCQKKNIVSLDSK